MAPIPLKAVPILTVFSGCENVKFFHDSPSVIGVCGIYFLYSNARARSCTMRFTSSIFSDVSLISFSTVAILSFMAQKAPAFLEEAQGCHACDISDWKRCRMKHNESPTLFVRGHYPFLLLRRLVFQFYVTRSEMNLDIDSLSVSLCCLVFILLY